MAESYSKNGKRETQTESNETANIRVDKKGVLRMTLRYFIDNLICHNTLVRLWKPYKGGNKMLLTENGKEVCMEWQILNGECHKKYADCYVIGVTDIVCDHSPEAVNIVIDVDGLV